MNTKKFVETLAKIKAKLEEDDKAREEVLQLQRNAIRVCSEAIKSIHRKEFDIADKKIKEAKTVYTKMDSKVKGIKSLECWNGFIDVLQELGEAIILNSIIRFDEIPSIEECSHDFSCYLLANCDVIGELRRYLMDSLRTRDYPNAQRAFDYMDFIYSELMTIDYTKMLVGPLRPKVDVARNLVNRSREDLINATQANDLIDSMGKLSSRLEEYKKTMERKN